MCAGTDFPDNNLDFKILIDLKASTLSAFINSSFWKCDKPNMEVMFLTLSWIFTDCFRIHVYLNDQIN